MPVTLFPLSRCPYCPLGLGPGHIEIREKVHYERLGSLLLSVYSRYSLSCPRCNPPGETTVEGLTSLDAAMTAAYGHAQHHDENSAAEHAACHPKQPPSEPQPLPPPLQRLPIAQAPPRYGGTWWVVCHDPTCYWLHPASTWAEAASHLSVHVFEHQIEETTHARDTKLTATSRGENGFDSTGKDTE